MENFQFDWYEFIAGSGDTEEESFWARILSPSWRQRWRTTIASWFVPPIITQSEPYVTAEARYQALDAWKHTYAADGKLDYAKAHLEAAEKSIEAFNQRAYTLLQYAAILAALSSPA